MAQSDTYFGSGSSTEAAGEPTWHDLNRDHQPFEMLPGLLFRPAAGEKAMINLVSFEPNVIAPVHSHDEEQIAFVIEGELEFEVNGETRTVGPGMAVVIPSNAPHGARTHDSACLALDVFGPPRQGLLSVIEARRAETGS